MTAVQPIFDERVLLDDSLRPMWTFLRYNRLLPNFFHQNPEKRQCYIARFVVTVIAALIILIYSLYLTLHSMKTSTTAEMIEISYNLIIMLTALFFQYQYLTNGDVFIQFYKDWRKIEIRSSENVSVVKKKRIAKFLSIFYLIFVIVYPIGIICWGAKQPTHPIFNIFNPLSGELINFNLRLWIIPCIMYYSNIYFCMGELLPTLFYYHAGCIIEDVEREFQNVFSCVSFDENSRLKSIWEKYEAVFRFVDRANRLFGPSILCHHLVGFLLKCLGVYSLMRDQSTERIDKFIFIFVIFLETLRTAWVNRLVSHLHLCRNQLQTSVAALLSQKWYELSEDERHLVAAFQVRLANGDLAASPFGFYNVKPSNLLSMLSLILTYVIVLLQFDV